MNILGKVSFQKFRGRINLTIIILAFFSACTFSNSKKYQVVSAKIHQKEKRNIPDKHRVAFGWQATGMFPGDTLLLTFNKKLKNRNNWLRLTVAHEIWEVKKIHALIPGTNIKLGTFDIRYSSVLVPYEIEIPNQYLNQVQKSGINLVLESRFPFWFFSNTTNESPGLSPHILSAEKATGSMDDFLNCFLSKNSVQAFGWREGTVLDGLWQIYAQTGNKKALETINQHLKLFFDKQNLIFENSRSRPHDNHVDGIESTIPFATLARLQPNHPILKTVVEGWQHLKKDNGVMMDDSTITAEGCYTISYPMAVIGKAWNDEALLKEAQEQLKHRFVLVDNGNFYLRYYIGSKSYTYQNWARGAAWVLLGYVRTVEELGVENVEPEIVAKFKEAVDVALSMQRTDGLWNCFMHEDNSHIDASGSAGIAASIMAGVDLGILSDEYVKPVQKTYDSLEQYITPDGFLKGVAQDNRAGEALQRSDYRVIAQMGMGMMAQLYSACWQYKINKEK